MSVPFRSGGKLSPRDFSLLSRPECVIWILNFQQFCMHESEMLISKFHSRFAHEDDQIMLFFLCTSGFHIIRNGKIVQKERAEKGDERRGKFHILPSGAKANIPQSENILFLCCSAIFRTSGKVTSPPKLPGLASQSSFSCLSLLPRPATGLLTPARPFLLCEHVSLLVTP
jgi:hypothetical protein